MEKNFTISVFFVFVENLNSELATKLNEIIDEGILDSILPFICTTNNDVDDSESSFRNNINRTKATRESNQITKPWTSPKEQCIELAGERKPNETSEHSLIHVKDKLPRKKSSQSTTTSVASSSTVK